MVGNAGELKNLFLTEFGAALTPVRDQYRRALMATSAASSAEFDAATRAAREYFHRMGGVAEMVGFPLAGEIAALCEGLCLLGERPEAVDVKSLIQSALDKLDRFFDDNRPPAATEGASGRVAPASVQARKGSRRT
jgi:hypothetical protein